MAGRTVGGASGIALSLLLGVAAGADAQMTCAPCAVGAVFDGPWAGSESVRSQIEDEIRALVEPRFEVVFPASAQRTGDWTSEASGSAVADLLADPAVDLVLTFGSLGSAHLLRAGELPKPALALFVLDAEAQGFPIETNAAGERVSGRPNLAYITFTRDAVEEIERLREVVAFERLTYLASDAILLANPVFGESLMRGMREAGGEAVIVRMRDSVSEALAALPADTEAVYVTPLPELSSEGFAELVAGLIEKRLPSFSWMGRVEVEQGLLASLYLETDLARQARRVALHVQRILLGEEPGVLPVDFERSRRLSLNLATARAIGVHPHWRVLTDAELLHTELQGPTRRLDLAAVTREALARNLELLGARRSVAAGLGAVRAARAPLLPQLRAASRFELIDADRAESTLGIQPRWTAVGALSASQVLWSDEARAGAEIERRRQESRERAFDEQRLDIVHAAAVSYLNVLRARTFERIQRDNLERTRVNLELARSRREIGVARATEVLRWENQLANHRRSVVEAGAAHEVARMTLNRLLDRPLEEAFETVDVDLDDPDLLAAAAILEDFVENPYAFALVRDFMAQEALGASPELRRLDASIAAAERALLAAQRAFWSPTVSASADLSTVGAPASEGSFNLLPDEFAIPERNAWNWSAGVGASIPLFAGGARWGERIQAREALDGLRLERRATASHIEQRLRSALHYAHASWAGIGLAEEGATAARRNLALVTDAYEQGALSILDLIDAQNAALIAEEGAATAVYDYLLDLMDAQRAAGLLDAFLDPPDVAAFTERIGAFFREAGYEPGGRPE